MIENIIYTLTGTTVLLCLYLAYTRVKYWKNKTKNWKESFAREFKFSESRIDDIVILYKLIENLEKEISLLQEEKAQLKKELDSKVWIERAYKAAEGANKMQKKLVDSVKKGRSNRLDKSW